MHMGLSWEVVASLACMYLAVVCPVISHITGYNIFLFTVYLHFCHSSLPCRVALYDTTCADSFLNPSSDMAYQTIDEYTHPTVTLYDPVNRLNKGKEREERKKSSAARVRRH